MGEGEGLERAGEEERVGADDVADPQRRGGDGPVAPAAVADGAPVCVAGTAFAFVQLCDELASRDLSFAFAPGSRVMETGGFKGRSRVVSRDELYASITARLGIPNGCIVAEYSMTELSSRRAPPGAPPLSGTGKSRRARRR